MKAKKKIKVAVLVGQLTHLGGVGIAAVNEVRELRKMGFNAELVILFRKKEFDSKKIFKAQDIPLVFLSDELPRLLRINFKFPFFSFFSLFHLTSIFTTPWLIKRHGYQLLLVHETYNCFAAMAAAKYNRIKLISFIWDPTAYIVPRVYGQGALKPLMPVLENMAKLIDKIILRNSDVTLLGSSLHERLLRSFNKKAKMVKVFPGAEPLERLPQERGKIVISLTKWDQGKNPEFLLATARRLKGNWQWLLAGNWVDKEQEKNFRQKIKKDDLEKKVILLGKISDKKKIEFLSKARLLVHPIIEAFGMFGLEAAACGCPIIIPRSSGVSELFQEGKHGFFPKENDLNTFVKKTQLLLDEEKKAISMGREAQKVAKRYSWRYHAQKIAKVIDELVNR